jgi:hypothetical protein
MKKLEIGKQNILLWDGNIKENFSVEDLEKEIDVPPSLLDITNKINEIIDYINEKEKK